MTRFVPMYQPGLAEKIARSARTLPGVGDFVPDQAVFWRKLAWNRQEIEEHPARVLGRTEARVKIEYLRKRHGYTTMTSTWVKPASLRGASDDEVRLIDGKLVYPDGIILRTGYSGCFQIHQQMREIEARYDADYEAAYWENLDRMTGEQRYAYGGQLKAAFEASKGHPNVSVYIEARRAWRKFRNLE